MAWAPDYATEDELGSYLRIDDTADDPELALAISGASRAIDQATNRQFGTSATAEDRFYTARYDYGRCCWVVDVDDYMYDVDDPAVEIDGTQVTTFDQEPVNAKVKARPWTRLAFTSDSEAQPTGETNEVTVTTLWGWSSVPPTVRNACLLQASRFFTRRVAPFGVAGSPDVGSEMRLLAKVDPDVEVQLRNFRRTRAVG